MPKPQLQIEQRMDNVEKAIEKLSATLTNQEGDFDKVNHDEIMDILNGTETASEASPDTAE